MNKPDKPKPKRQRLMKGMGVIVNKNIYRKEEYHERIDKLPPKPDFPKLDECSSFDEYSIKYDEYFKEYGKYERKFVPYAVKGETGIIIDLFRIRKRYYRSRVDFYAKVQIDDKIKTFRYGSLDVINTPKR